MNVLWALGLIAVAMPGIIRPAAAQVSQTAQLFDTANDQFASGQYADALATYQDVLDSGFASGALYHNMGSTFYRLDQIGQAIRHYEKARRHMGDDPQLMHNIRIVEDRIGSPFSVLPEPFWRSWWKSWFAMRNPWWLLVAGGMLYLIGTALYAHRIWTQVRNDWLRRLRAGMLLMGCFLLVIAVGISADKATSMRAAILKPDVELTSDDGTVTVPEGIIVTIVAREPAGTEVQLPNGARGFVDDAVLGEI